MSMNNVPHNDPNSAQYSALQQVGRVHSECALRALGTLSPQEQRLVAALYCMHVGRTPRAVDACWACIGHDIAQAWFGRDTTTVS